MQPLEHLLRDLTQGLLSQAPRPCLGATVLWDDTRRSDLALDKLQYLGSLELETLLASHQAEVAGHKPRQCLRLV